MSPEEGALKNARNLTRDMARDDKPHHTTSRLPTFSQFAEIDTNKRGSAASFHGPSPD